MQRRIRRSTRTGRQWHSRRDVSARRPMHLTSRLLHGLPSLRNPDTLAVFRTLVEGARARGLRVIAYCLMSGHIHLWVRAGSRQALGRGMQFLLGGLARHVNRRAGRRSGPVFSDRYYAVVARSAKQVWRSLNYVVRNPWAAGLRHPRWDPYTGVDVGRLGAESFLRSIFGPAVGALVELLQTMRHARVPYASVNQRLQLSLPLGASP